mmetsp:Transcript_15758/g.32330  ORF Transcript_15758/g.32330 Transcript_15758/m.32330 type:complete len:294 (-) Transcript_15758:2426-3307(-)
MVCVVLCVMRGLPGAAGACGVRYQTLRTLSPPQLSKAVESLKKQTCFTASSWPYNRRRGKPVATFQRMRKLSRPEDTRRWPSSLKATLFTAASWPSRVDTRCPDLVSHSRTVPSLEPDATRFSSKLKSAWLMLLWWHLESITPSNASTANARMSPVFPLLLATASSSIALISAKSPCATFPRNPGRVGNALRRRFGSNPSLPNTVGVMAPWLPGRRVPSSRPFTASESPRSTAMSSSPGNNTAACLRPIAASLPSTSLAAIVTIISSTSFSRSSADNSRGRFDLARFLRSCSF